MRVLIFTEGGSQIGLGHIYRCSSLYEELDAQGVEVRFIVYGNINNIDIIENKNLIIHNWLSADFLNQYINNDDYCIVDSYLASEKLYTVISERAKMSLYIDDNARIRYPKGIVVNPSLSTKAVQYPTDDENCYLLGPKYIILRKPFMEAQRTVINPEVKEVLVTLGGSDIRNLTPVILKELSSRYPNVRFNVVIGHAYENVDGIKKFKSDNINFYQNVDAQEMRNIMLKSDFAITAAGQTIYELLATQTAFIPIRIAENQNNNIVGLEEYKLVETVLDYKDSLFLEKIKTEFEKFMNYDIRNELAWKYKKSVDGLGAKRIVDSLIKEDILADAYFLRKVREEDIHNVFKLSNEDYVREYSINNNKISWEEHIVWFKNIIKSSHNFFYIVTDYADRFLGQLRYKIEDNSAVVSISLCKTITGKGLSVKLLNESIRLVTAEKNELEAIIAFVSEKNIASKKLFEKANFQLLEKCNGLLKYVYSVKRG